MDRLIVSRQEQDFREWGSGLGTGRERGWPAWPTQVCSMGLPVSTKLNVKVGYGTIFWVKRGEREGLLCLSVCLKDTLEGDARSQHQAQGREAAGCGWSTPDQVGGDFSPDQDLFHAEGIHTDPLLHHVGAVPTL